jgi:sortase (surface protein transpeptidase)
MSNGANNFYRSDRLSTEKVSFNNQYQMKIVGNLFLPKDRRPGVKYPAIIVGHVRFVTPGVFARLTDLRSGDEINVLRKDGSTARFRVTRLAHFAKSAFPTKKVYGNIDHAGLRLITCGGLDADSNKFEENVVVFADLERA